MVFVDRGSLFEAFGGQKQSCWIGIVATRDFACGLASGLGLWREGLVPVLLPDGAGPGDCCRPAGVLSAPAHVGNSSKVTQSMCRTVAATGRDQSACVACQMPCIDIDAERQYWKNLTGKRGLAWAWYSYPGLVLAFFQLMIWGAPIGGGYALNLVYLRGGIWAFDARLPQRALQPFVSGIPIPRLVLIPVLLVLAGWLSVQIFSFLERRLHDRHKSSGRLHPMERAINQTRLLASFIAINGFFWFAAPLQGVWGSEGDRLLRLVVIACTAVVLFRSWRRTEENYRRESTSESLRRQLKDRSELASALDGRSFEDLTPDEVFTLAKALPAVGRSQACLVY